MVLMTIPLSCEKGHLLEFAFGSEPIIKLIAWVAVPLEINLICPAPDFLVTWSGVCRSILGVRLNRTCVVLERHISLAFQCHTPVLS